jgi:hypothetical protein
MPRRKEICIWYEIVKDRSHLGHLGIDERIILIGILKSYGGRVWLRVV